MAVIRNIKPDAVEIVDVDDQCENGIMWDTAKVPGVVEKFRRAGVDALFIPFCDFGEEQVAAQIAAAFKLPTLVWGARDERPNSDEARRPGYPVRYVCSHQGAPPPRCEVQLHL